MNWFFLRIDALKDSLKRLLSRPIVTISNIVGLGISIAIPAGLFLLVASADNLSRDISESTQMNVFLDLGINDEQVNKIKQRLSLNYVKEVKLIDRDDALKSLRENNEIAVVLDNIDNNPLPHTLVVTAKEGKLVELEALGEEAKTWEGVDQIAFDSDWARRLQSFIDLGKVVALCFGALFAVGIIANTYNLIRLQVLNRREEIEVAKLVGATNSFIRRPFLYFGALQGLFGGLLAVVIIEIGSRYSVSTLNELFSQAGITFQRLTVQELGVLIIISALLGIIGAWFATNRLIAIYNK